jgi:type III restriction enzyme
LKQETSISLEIKEILFKLTEYLNTKYKLLNPEMNENILKNNGFIIQENIISEVKQGKYRTISEIQKDNDRTRISFEVNTHKHGIDLLHEIFELSKIIHVDYNDMKIILYRMFLINFSCI